MNAIVSHRIRRDICASWKFHLGPTAGAEGVAFDDAAWRSLDLPHDWSIEGPFDPKNDKWTGYLPKGVGWYRKRLTLDPQWANRRIWLEFEGVFRNSTLFVNGKKVGTHPYGYTGVIHDITPHVHCDGESNVVSVLVDNPTPHDLELKGGATRIASYTGDKPDPSCEGWWYEGCGIYRPVWLIVTDRLHIDNWSVFVSTPAVSKSRATARIEAVLRNAASEDQACSFQTTILDAKAKAVVQGEWDAPIKAQSILVQDRRFEIRRPKLWSPDSPYLYTARVEIVRDGQVIDRTDTPFGIRWFEFTSDRGFFFNGKPMQLRGGNAHHDFGGLGAALPARANAKTVETLKAMGANALRCAHNDAAPALMDACDRLGLLAWAETRYLDRPEIAVPPLQSLIRRNRNHPSILCWSLANTAGSLDGRLTEYLKVLNGVAHEEDPTRPTAVALEGNTNANTNGFALVTDIVGYNGGGMRKDDADHAAYPERRMLVSEFASARCARGVYDERVFREDAASIPSSKAAVRNSARYLCFHESCAWMEQEWAHVAERPWLAGGFIWSGIEYYGETVGWPIVTGQFGPLDLCRFPKDGFYYYQQEWTERPMVHLLPHWTWPGREGQTIRVWCYSNCDRVELFLNGRSLGVEPKRPRTHIEWKVPYEPGRLVARGMKNGAVACECEVRTAGPAAALRLAPDRAVVAADGKDVSFITVRVVDGEGNFAPTADNPIEIAVEGPGRLIGLCNSDPACHVSPKSSGMPAFNGLLLAIVQSLDTAGGITVTAASPGIQGARTFLTSEPLDE